MRECRHKRWIGLVPALLASSLCAQQTLQRGEATVRLEPYAPNIVRVTLSLRSADAVAAPGPGILATVAAAGWSATTDAEGDLLQSPQLQVHVRARRNPRKRRPARRPTSPNSLMAAHHMSASASAPVTASRCSTCTAGKWPCPITRTAPRGSITTAAPATPPFYTVRVRRSGAASDEHDYGGHGPEPGGLARPPRPRAPLRARLQRTRRPKASACRFSSPTRGYGLLWGQSFPHHGQLRLSTAKTAF